MKNILYLFLLLFFAQCKTEKQLPATTSNDGPVFSKNQYLNSYEYGGFEKTYPANAAYTSDQLYAMELINNNLPKDKEDVILKHPNSLSFEDFIKVRSGGLSENAMAHLSRLFLITYTPWSFSYSKQLAGTTVQQMNTLVEKKFTGYSLIYNVLAWLKQNNDNNYSLLKTKVMQYARPVVIKKDPSKPDSPELNQFPELKQSLLNIEKSIEDNKTAYEKIAAL